MHVCVCYYIKKKQSSGYQRGRGMGGEQNGQRESAVWMDGNKVFGGERAIVYIEVKV